MTETMMTELCTSGPEFDRSREQWEKVIVTAKWSIIYIKPLSKKKKI